MRKKQGSRLGKNDLPANKTNKRSEAYAASGAAFPPDFLGSAGKRILPHDS